MDKPIASVEITPAQITENGIATKRLSIGCDESDGDHSIHAFNISNVTVIEISSEPKKTSEPNKMTSNCEGSDSGVEVLEITDTFSLQRTLSNNSSASQEFRAVTPAHSCDSSILSCCSNIDEAYTLLARRNSTLLEDYKLRCDGTSEGGSESSSVTGSNDSGKNFNKRKTNGTFEKNKNVSQKTRSRPPSVPKPGSSQKLTEKSITRQSTTRIISSTRVKNVPDTLNLNSNNKKEPKRTVNTVRTNPAPKTPTDGRWPSINSKPAPLMTRSLRGILSSSEKNSKSAMAKTLDKYGTLPRRRREKSAESIQRTPKNAGSSRESSLTRGNFLRSKLKESDCSATKVLPPYPKRKVAKTKIYHEIGSQTLLTSPDIDKMCTGETVNPVNPLDVEKLEKSVQVDLYSAEIATLNEELVEAQKKYGKLLSVFNEQENKLRETEKQMMCEKLEKEGLRDELKQNSDRVLAILAQDQVVSNNDEDSNDSLLLLETRYTSVSEVVIRQEEEISRLHSLCRLLKRDLDNSKITEKSLSQQLKDLESENFDIQEFMKAEMNTLQDSLKEAETEIGNFKLTLSQKDEEIDLIRKQVDIVQQEKVRLKCRLGALEAKSRELLVQQGSTVSGAAVALSALIARLQGLIEEFISSYNISEQELEDVIFHNEVYTNSSSSPETTPQKMKKKINDKTPSPSTGSGFVSAVINAIKNAATTQITRTPENESSFADCSYSSEFLDSETEPCLMMDPVLEDVVIPDGFSRNMISSSHNLINRRLSYSHNDLLGKMYSRQCSDDYASLEESFHSDISSVSDICPSTTLVDQVIELDNLMTRLLKVMRFIQVENENCLTDLEEEKSDLKHQYDKQRDLNKTVVRQLKDWELLGARLKTDIKELQQQVAQKNTENENVKGEINQQRKEIERLNKDVCDLSTALSKADLEPKVKNEVHKTNNVDSIVCDEALARLSVLQKEIPLVKEKLKEKEKQLSDVSQEYVASKQIYSQNLREAMTETKKLYDAIDAALETFHSIQSVVQQCAPLAKLQRELEETSFQAASALPIVVPADLNANAARLQPVTNIDIATPINSTA